MLQFITARRINNIFIKKNMSSRFFLSFCVFLLLACNEQKNKGEATENNTITPVSDPVKVIPISHGSLILEADGEVIYIDPTGGEEAYQGQKKPTMVFITDIHGDHLSLNTLEAINITNVPLIAPRAVLDKIPSSLAKNTREAENNLNYEVRGISFEVIPMYNLREEALQFHEKGRGNGYVIALAGQRIYISGDTEDIPEMRQLQEIDKAFVCMNLPYTMPVESAADAVLDFKPKKVYPYHYRGQGGLSDVQKFKTLVNTGNSDIEVIQLNWYK
jgi:L-ascorbate metabolism protein UlaG (beta-lactamase superfamily)